MTLTRRTFVKETLLTSTAVALGFGARGADAPAAAAKPATGRTEFFPFCIDTHDAKKRSLEQQAQMLKELGYDGVGHLWLDNIPERLKTLDAAGLKLYQITITVDIAPGKTPYDPRLKEVMPLLKGRGVQFDLLINGMKPSDPAGDDRAVAVLRELSDLAEPSGAVMLLYPHTACWLETVQDCARVCPKVNRPNVAAMFNLCHWLRVSKDRDYAGALKQVMPWLKAVSINGAEEWDSRPDWSGYIQPLGRGSFDVFKLLQELRAQGYRGAVGLQCYGIPGDVREHLEESMKAWRGYQQRLAGK